MQVLHFVTASGRDEINRYLLGLPVDQRAACDASLLNVQQYGFLLPPQILKKLKGQKQLWELRVKSRNEYRFLITNRGASFIVLHAFTKKTQKTPLKEIKTAIQRKNQL